MLKNQSLVRAFIASMFVAGSASIVCGVGMIYLPLAPIAAGAVMVAIAIGLATGK